MMSSVQRTSGGHPREVGTFATDCVCASGVFHATSCAKRLEFESRGKQAEACAASVMFEQIVSTCVMTKSSRRGQLARMVTPAAPSTRRIVAGVSSHRCAVENTPPWTLAARESTLPVRSDASRRSERSSAACAAADAALSPGRIGPSWGVTNVEGVPGRRQMRHEHVHPFEALSSDVQDEPSQLLRSCHPLRLLPIRVGIDAGADVPQMRKRGAERAPAGRGQGGTHGGQLRALTEDRHQLRLHRNAVAVPSSMLRRCVQQRSGRLGCATHDEPSER